MEEKNLLSPWAAHLADQLARQAASIIVERQLSSHLVQVVLTRDSLVAVTSKTGGAKMAFRIVYTPAADLVIENSEADETELKYTLRSSLGSYEVVIGLQSDKAIDTLHYTVHFTPDRDLVIPFWPRDILVMDEHGAFSDMEAKIHVEQLGIRSGMVYFSVEKPRTGAVLYLQNLTALNDYCADTGVSVADAVDGNWPELGFALPAGTEKPLYGGKPYGISDAFVAFVDSVPKGQFAIAKQFMELLAHLYLILPKPPTSYHDYLKMAENAIQGLGEHKGCWSHHHGHGYLNAYVCDYKTPPEIMVQLAVLLPMIDYADWSGRENALIAKLEAGLRAFYDADLGTVQRWLPAAADQLDGSEEHKKPMVMDSWYLHHPLLNLSRMAVRGDEVAKELFVKSLDYAIKVARHFDYKWPIFYKMDTLEVIKAEAAPGDGG